MAKISLAIKEFELGVKVSDQLAAAGHTVEFLENSAQITQHSDILVISANSEEDFNRIGEKIYTIGYADRITKDKMREWEMKGFDRVILRSTLVKNIAKIVSQIVEERK